MRWLFLIVAAALYFVPCWVAISRKHRSQLAIGIFNVLLGWTVLGWILALVWACTSNVEQPAPATKTRRCPYCAEAIHADAKRCKHCHADLDQTPQKCSCGQALFKDDQICPRCGTSVA